MLAYNHNASNSINYITEEKLENVNAADGECK